MPENLWGDIFDSRCTSAVQIRVVDSDADLRWQHQLATTKEIPPQGARALGPAQSSSGPLCAVLRLRGWSSTTAILSPSVLSLISVEGRSVCWGPAWRAGHLALKYMQGMS